MSFYERFARRLSDPHICDPAPPFPLLLSWHHSTAHCCQVLQAADTGNKKHNPKTITNIPLRHIRAVPLHFSRLLSICLSHSFSSAVIKVCITFYCSLKRSLCRIRGTCTHMVPSPVPLPPDAAADADLDGLHRGGAALGHSGCQVYRIK